MKRLYVGNLPSQACEAELREWFEKAGFLPSCVMFAADRSSGHLTGFGFVEVDDGMALQVVLACNGKHFLGHMLVVNETAPGSEHRPAGDWIPSALDRESRFR